MKEFKPVWTLYILECKDRSLYTGITNNLPARLAAHEEGKGAKYTRGRGPLKVVYTETHKTRSEASKREIVVKAFDKVQKLGLISGL